MREVFKDCHPGSHCMNTWCPTRFWPKRPMWQIRTGRVLWVGQEYFCSASPPSDLLTCELVVHGAGTPRSRYLSLKDISLVMCVTDCHWFKLKLQLISTRLSNCWCNTTSLIARTVNRCAVFLGKYWIQTPVLLCKFPGNNVRLYDTLKRLVIHYLYHGQTRVDPDSEMTRWYIQYSSYKKTGGSSTKDGYWV